MVDWMWKMQSSIASSYASDGQLATSFINLVYASCGGIVVVESLEENCRSYAQAGIWDCDCNLIAKAEMWMLDFGHLRLLDERIEEDLRLRWCVCCD